MIGAIVLLWIVHFPFSSSTCSNLGSRVVVYFRSSHGTDGTHQGRRAGWKTDCCSGTGSGTFALSTGTVVVAGVGGRLSGFACCRSV